MGEMTLVPGDEVTVRLVKGLHRDVQYPVVVVSDDGTHVVVRGPWAGPDTRDFGFVRFENGDIFTEHYWRDRWYSVKEVRSGSGELKGWYCDVCRPANVEPGALIAADLYLDLWLSADRSTMLRLDEDEFRASGLAEQDPAAAAQAWQALDELERLAHAGFTGLDQG